jgi:ornithine--oxo-acid transaminase
MLENGLLAKQTHEHIIRFAPPLVISDDQLDQALSIIEDSLKSFA